MPVLVIGGAGFIGSNLVHRLRREGHRVRVLDDLSRPGAERNLAWLRERHGSAIEAVIASVLDRRALGHAVHDARAVFHLAAQVAVTSSLRDPVRDFEINARGTLNLLEELRALGQPPPLVFTSTNKVYGELDDIALDETATRYWPTDVGLGARGIDEQRPLCFRSPYGCSKGVADQYVLDYARTFGLPAAVLRMSCVFGPRQYGTEEQGWVAHFLLRSLSGAGVTLHGDGKQVRDVLFVDDLVNALILAWSNIGRIAGQAFNLGGGPERAVSLIELIALIQELMGGELPREHAPWRPGDQRYYVSDVRAFQEATSWRPRVGVRQGVVQLCDWLLAGRGGAAPRAAAWRR